MADKAPSKAARPAKSRKGIARPKLVTKPKIEIDLVQVELFARQGLSQEQISAALGISETTFYNRLRESEEFAACIKRGRAQGIGVVTDHLMKQIEGGNVTAMIFYLKSRAGWREVSQTELTGANGGPIQHAEVPIERFKQARKQMLDEY